VGAGRELLRALGRAGVPWTGFDVTTLRPLALELALPALAAEGLTVQDEFQEEALLDDAMDGAADTRAGAAFAPLLAGPGFRRGVRGAVSALELAGVTAERLARVPLPDPDRRDFLVEVLGRFHRSVAGSGRVGLAEVLRRAAVALGDGAPLRWDRILLLPGLPLKGASGRLVQLLVERGAETVAADPVGGLGPPDTVLWRAHPEPAPFSDLNRPPESPPVLDPTPAAGEQKPDWTDLPLFAEAADAVSPSSGGSGGPSLDVFHAGGIEEELLEVVRRILEEGHAWHDVEIVTPDPAAYGAALQGLAERLSIPVTFAVGLPVERTVPGRAVAAYLSWLREDFPASVLHGLLARGELRAPRPWDDVPGDAMGRALRRLRIGWGRGRFLPALDRAVLRARARVEDADAGPPKDRAERSLRTHLALRAVAHRILDTTPETVRAVGDATPRIPPGALARGIRTVLGLLRLDGEVDETARDRLLRILDRAEASLHRPVPLAVAVATLQDHLAIRVPAPRAEGRAPWVSDAGSLHLSDLEHGGLSGRPRTFLVGMDAGRFPGTVRQDPFLLDRERRAISAALPTSGDRMEEARFDFASLLARLRGHVTLSHPVWDAAAARTLMPSPALLQAHRLRSGKPRAGFDDLREGMGQPVSRVPRRGSPVDVQDVWLAALATETGFNHGTEAVRRGFPTLSRGLAAREAWAPGTPATAHTGWIPDPPEAVERALDEPFSPTRLEALGSCPLRFLLGYVAGLRAPDDPAFVPDRWLDPARRGSLLHKVFETVLRTLRDEGIAPSSPEAEDVAARLLARAVDELSRVVPAPSTAVRDREASAMATDLRCFLGHLDGRDREWTALELGFGFEDEVTLAAGSGGLRIRGRIDRIDRTPGGDLVVVDYKTGRVSSLWQRSTGIWRGGRRLQHLVYAHAAEAVLGARVGAVEYHFPTLRGEGEVVGFARNALEDGPDLLARLVDAARSGAFVPTDDAGDCRFCDFRPVCRVREDLYGNVRSPAAEFGAAAREAGDPAYRWLEALRRWEEEE
jgi:ATP-dependent helicase/nuclease subunit B